jgi:hypothetical protein
MFLSPAKNLSAKNAGPTVNLLAPIGLLLLPSDEAPEIENLERQSEP